MTEKVRGRLLIIGGHEDKKHDKLILRKMVEFAGGERAHVVICTVASTDQEETGEEYRRLFLELGVARAEILRIHDRLDALRFQAGDWFTKATGLFFTGGDQLRITSTLGGTPLSRQIRRLYEQGVLLAGTSAGAAAMSDIMIVGGDGTESPRLEQTYVAPGMGYLEEVIIDQHFNQRGRISRLLGVLAQNPFVLGLGIDEDTAVYVQEDGTAEVYGSGTVTILDASRATTTNASRVDPAEALAIADVRLHVLPSGYRFQLEERVVLHSGKAHSAH